MRTTFPRMLDTLAAALMLAAVFAMISEPDALASGDEIVLADSPWPMFGHDAQHTFRTSLLGPTSAELLPPIDVPGGALTALGVTAGGTIVLGAGFSHFGVRADGAILWETPIGTRPRLSAAAIAADGTYFMGDRANHVRKADSASGATACVYAVHGIAGDVRGSPTISVQFPDRVYFGEAGVAGALFAVRMNGASACEEIWKIKLKGGSPASVALADSVPGNGDARILVFATPGHIYKVEDVGDSAQILADRDLHSRMLGPSPMVDPATGNIYIGTKRRLFFGLAPDLTDLFPPVKLDSPIRGTAALSPDGETVYVATDRGFLHALDAHTGATRAGFPVSMRPGRFPRGSAPAVDGAGNIYVAPTDGRVRALSPGGSLLWEAQVEGSIAHPPTIVDGGLLLIASLQEPSTQSGPGGTRVLVPGLSKLHRFCPPSAGPPEARQVCGFTIDTTAPPLP